MTAEENRIDGAYLLGVFNVAGMDGLSKEIKRLKELGVMPHQIPELHQTPPPSVGEAIINGLDKNPSQAEQTATLLSICLRTLDTEHLLHLANTIIAKRATPPPSRRDELILFKEWEIDNDIKNLIPEASVDLYIDEMGSQLSVKSNAESEEQIQEWARKIKLDFTQPQDFALGWRKCYEWIKGNEA